MIIPLKCLVLCFCIVKLGYCSSMIGNGKRIKRRISPLEATVKNMKTCDQTGIPAMETFDIEKFSGGWYELGKTVSGLADIDDGIWMLTDNFVTGGYNFVFRGRSSDSQCLRPVTGSILPSEDNPGELHISYRMHSTKVSERIRILDTDYETLAIVYTCMHVTSDGTCHPAGVMGAIWTRLPHVDVRVFDEAILILDKACIDSRSVMIKTKHGQGICPPDEVTSSEEKTVDDVQEPSCKDFSRCALHCPPCCRERSDGCVKCDCENVVVDQFVKCQYGMPCPYHCKSKEMYLGCYVCNCKDEIVKTAICLESKEPGTCANKIDRYYYSVSTRSCQKFVYTGCGGTKNNFETLESCTETCTDQKKQGPSLAKINTGAGHETTKSSTLIVICILTVYLIMQSLIPT